MVPSSFCLFFHFSWMSNHFDSLRSSFQGIHEEACLDFCIRVATNGTWCICGRKTFRGACSSVFFDSNSKETFCNNNDGSTSLKMQPQRSSNRVGHHARSPHVVWNRLTHHDVQKQRQKWPLMWTVCPKGLVQLNLYLAFLEKFQRLLIKIGFLRFHYTRWKWDSPHPSQLSRLKLKHLRNP